MTKAIRIHATGGPEVLSWDDIDVPSPGRGEVVLRHTAIGVNYADVNLRRGNFYLYDKLPLPAVLGNEGAGVVEAIGPDVTELAVGDHVAYVNASGSTASPGSYSERRIIGADRLVKIPDGVSDEQAAASLLKGLTAWCIVRRAFPVQPGQVVLVHAAAGGVSSFLTQWSRHLGATVIGTVGNAEKAEIAKADGCAHVILYREKDFVAETRRLYPGGISAVFDGVGKDTFLPSLDCLKPLGMLVNFGNASGPPPLLDVRMLSQKGSLVVTRVGLGHFLTERAALVAATSELLGLIANGTIKVHIARKYPLREAAQAHRDLESGRTVGSLILTP
jgi:NADPH2:quinone reductase